MIGSLRISLFLKFMARLLTLGCIVRFRDILFILVIKRFMFYKLVIWHFWKIIFPYIANAHLYRSRI